MKIETPEIDKIDWWKESPKEGIERGKEEGGAHPRSAWQIDSHKKNRRIQNTICQPSCFTFLPLITHEGLRGCLAQTLIQPSFFPPNNYYLNLFSLIWQQNHCFT